MLHRIKRRFRDMSTLKDLCLAAERYALADQQHAPRAEHFLLSALDLPDGTARGALKRMNMDSAGVRHALTRQHHDALRSIGISSETISEVMAEVKPLRDRFGAYNAAPSGRAVMQALAYRADADRTPLLGAHVMAVIAAMPRDTTARALQRMGVDLDDLRAAAEAEIEASHPLNP